MTDVMLFLSGKVNREYNISRSMKRNPDIYLSSSVKDALMIAKSVVTLLNIKKVTVGR